MAPVDNLKKKNYIEFGFKILAYFEPSMKFTKLTIAVHRKINMYQHISFAIQS